MRLESILFILGLYVCSAECWKSFSEIKAELSSALASLYPTVHTETDSFIYNSTFTELMVISNSTALSECQKCINRLQIGKTMALSRPDMVPDIWTDWCIASDWDDATDCELDFGRMTVANASTGTNFVNMLRLMDPMGYDGQLYCYFKESVCDMPETPPVDISYMWPEKPADKMQVPIPSNETFNVLHISDFHLELLYQVGAEANCTDNTMCCAPHNYNEDVKPAGYNFTDNLDFGANGESYYNSSYVNGEFVKGDYIDVFANDTVWWPATTFGNYLCDAPEILINSSLRSVAAYQKELNLNFEFAIFTGDLVDHDELQYQDLDTTIKEEEYIFRDMKANLENIPIFPTLGNHDNYPYGQIAQESSGFSNIFNWNAELLAEIWDDYSWIDEHESKYSAKHYAAFSVKTKRGLKVISLNSNTYYKKNYYAFWNATNPDSFGQFQFLVDELLESESKNEHVWIIAHIPFIQEALPVQAKAFSQIVERFSPSTISEIFFGHTHLDQFNLLYTNSTEKTVDELVNNAWITHAVTPWVEYNPAWRYYEIDSETFQVMNAYNYYTKLNETFVNDGAEPVWEFEYSPRDSYNVSWPADAPLNATYWHYVSQQIKTDLSVNQQFVNFETRLSPYTPTCESDSGICPGNWCYLSSFTLEELTDCEEQYNVTYSYPS